MRVIPLNRIVAPAQCGRGGGAALSAGLLLALSAAVSFAEGAVEPLTPLPAQDIGASITRMTGALALVFAVLLGGAWLFKNWQRFAMPRGRQPRLNVHEVRSLGHRHALYVVGYDQQRMLLAASPSGVTLLAELPAEERAETALEPAEPENRFLAALQRAVARPT